MVWRRVQGRRAPAFELPGDDGAVWGIEGLRGQWVVLVFYPRDFSPVCTAQLCHYGQWWQREPLRGVVVLGISPDTVAQHGRFRQRYRLPFPLLADERLEVFRRYGMVLFGVMPARGIVVIDPEGQIRWWWRSLTGLRYPSAQRVWQILQRLQSVDGA